LLLNTYKGFPFTCFSLILSKIFLLMRKIYLLPILLLTYLVAFSQERIRPPFFQYEKDHWVDSVFYSLSIDQKIGQLIMVPAYSNKGQSHIQQIIKYIKENKIGGVITMQGGPVRQANLVNKLQENSTVPLFIATDAEWGLGMRLDSTIKYPYNMTLGALTDDSLIFRLGADIAQQCKRIGININFAPVADVNINPLNPVIGYRSYGDDPKKVLQKSVLFSLGMQSQNILPTLKHFPGHGDTEIDSHLALPVITHSRARLDSVELFPFREAIKRGIGGIMTAHLNVTALDIANIPSSLSKKIIQDLLVGEMGYEGLIVTDAMNMQGIASQVKEGNAEVMALQAGNDLMEFVTDPAKTITSIKNAINDGTLSFDDINKKCRKILMIKRWLGLNNYSPVKTANLYRDLNKSSYRMTIRNAVQKSLTVLQNKNKLLPLGHLDTLKIAAVSVGAGSVTPFQVSLGRYTAVTNFNIKKDASAETIRKTLSQLKKYNLVIAGLTNLGLKTSNNFNLSNSQAEVIKQITDRCNSIIVVFGNPYVLNYLDGIEKAKGLILTYQDSNDAQDLAGQLIFGAVKAEGRLPVTVNKSLHSNEGLTTSALGRFKYTLPEEVGIDSTYLKNKIDSLIGIGLHDEAFPGCEVFLAKNGNVFFNECYGFHTYSSNRAMQPDDLFDFASLTKVIAPLPAIMHLYDDKKFFLNKKMSDYWPDWKGSNKQSINVNDILSHQARLEAWIPFWRQTVNKKGQFKPGYFSKDSTSLYSLHVSKNLFVIKSYPDSVYAAIRKSPLLKKKKYVYSDLGFIIFPKIIANLSGKDYETYLKEKFYRPLGAYTLTYKPYLHYPIDRMVPTEDDQLFRHEQLQGFVHDEGAAILGGVSGNAGLFGTINDAAKMMQMYLNYGQYGGERYLSQTTLKDWTSRHFESNGNRRGYGFDKPLPHNYTKNLNDAYPAPLVSDESFGHSGYTGTWAWADPKNGLLYLFFSNRVYPTRENNKINQLNLRILVQQAVYQALNHSQSSDQKR
jgi:beta-N-acetylhexosaminidase